MDGFDPTLADFGGPIINATIGMAGAGILIAVLMRYLPETSIFKWLILERSVGGAATVSGPDLADTGKEEVSFIGRTGILLGCLDLIY